MKYKSLQHWIIAVLIIVISASTTDSYSQNGLRTRRLPDGTIIYSDGTIKRTDGTIKYPDGRVKQVDGSIKFPDGTVRFPGNNSNNNWLPPGQAKKRYGVKNARPFAPGHQKKDLFLNDNRGKGKNK